MLALTRRIGEEVVIGDPKDPLGFVRVVDVSGDRVRLAFSFPREVAINRRELAEEKRVGKRPAPQGASPPPGAAATHPDRPAPGSPSPSG